MAGGIANKGCVLRDPDLDEIEESEVKVTPRYSDPECESRRAASTARTHDELVILWTKLRKVTSSSTEESCTEISHGKAGGHVPDIGHDNEAFQLDEPSYCYQHSQNNYEASSDVKIASPPGEPEKNQCNDGNPARGNWSHRPDFLLACVAFSVGIGNFWSFQYNQWYNAGGSFFLPYLIMVLLCGHPMLMLEMTLGQFISGNAITVWRSVSCISGIGYSMLIACVVLAIYHNSVIAWNIYYLYSSLILPLPWKNCNATWNTIDCSLTEFANNCSLINGRVDDINCQRLSTRPSSQQALLTAANVTTWVSPAQEYFQLEALSMSSGLHDMAGLRWGLLPGCVLVWAATFFSLWAGVKSMSKVLYVTCTLTLALLLTLLVRLCLIDGSFDGIIHYIVPHFDRLKDIQVWYAASVQMFFTLSPGLGVYTVLAGYNRFHYNYQRDAVVIVLTSVVVSFLIGCMLFAAIGGLASHVDTPVERLIVTGYDLCYIVLPQALALLPGVWSFMFYLFLVLLAFSGQLPLMEVIITTLIDLWPFTLKRRPCRPIVLAWLCGAMFFVGLLSVNKGSIYLMVLLENYAVHWTMLVLCIVQSLSACWLFGFHRTGSAVEAMLGHRLSDWWQAAWKWAAPSVVVFTLVMDTLRHLSLAYGTYQYPLWALAVGYILSMGPLAALPIMLVYAVTYTSGPVSKRLSQLSKLPANWGPALAHHRSLLVREVPDYVQAEPDQEAIIFSEFSSKDSVYSLNSKQSTSNGYVDNVNWADNLDTGSLDWSSEENTTRGNWSSRIEFLLSCLGYSVGLGNVWRFPFLCYRNGGGAFFIPYVLMMLCLGTPLYYLELALGQYSSRGPTQVWNCVPLLRGMGLTMVSVSLILSLYYNVVISWAVYYLFSSMTAVLPWAECNNTWNTPDCSVNATSWSNTSVNGSSQHFIQTSPTEEFFINEVLGRSDSITEIGYPRWPLTLCLLLSWIAVFVCICRGIKSAGKAAFFMATFPYILLTVLMIRALTLEGYDDGIRYYVTPDWMRLCDSVVWYDAAVQALFSLSTCYGGLIMLASYSPFHNNCARDAMMLALGDFFTSTFAGFVIFAILGVMAHSAGTTVEMVVTSEMGLTFIAIPDAVARLPVSPLWSFSFFLMLFLMGLDTQMVSVELMAVTLVEEFPVLVKKKVYITLALCCSLFLLGIPLVTDGGSYVLVLLDSYAATWPILVVAILEPITVAWIYGIQRFSKDIKAMTNEDPSVWWKAMWTVVSPIILLFVLIFSMATYEAPKYEDYAYPWWSHVIGWIIVTATLSPIIICACVVLRRSSGATFMERLRNSIKASEQYGPALEKNRRYAAYFQPVFARSASTTSVTVSDGNAQTETPIIFDRRTSSQGIIRRDLPDDVITTSPRRVRDLKRSLQKEILKSLPTEYAGDENVTVQLRPSRSAPVRHVATQTKLSPIGEECETEETCARVHVTPPDDDEQNVASCDKNNQTHFDGSVSVYASADVQHRADQHHHADEHHTDQHQYRADQHHHADEHRADQHQYRADQHHHADQHNHTDLHQHNTDQHQHTDQHHHHADQFVINVGTEVMAEFIDPEDDLTFDEACDRSHDESCRECSSATLVISVDELSDQQCDTIDARDNQCYTIDVSDNQCYTIDVSDDMLIKVADGDKPNYEQYLKLSSKYPYSDLNGNRTVPKRRNSAPFKSLMTSPLEALTSELKSVRRHSTSSEYVSECSQHTAL